MRHRQLTQFPQAHFLLPLRIVRNGWLRVALAMHVRPWQNVARRTIMRRRMHRVRNAYHTDWFIAKTCPARCASRRQHRYSYRQLRTASRPLVLYLSTARKIPARPPARVRVLVFRLDEVWVCFGFSFCCLGTRLSDTRHTTYNTTSAYDLQPRDNNRDNPSIPSSATAPACAEVEQQAGVRVSPSLFRILQLLTVLSLAPMMPRADAIQRILARRR